MHIVLVEPEIPPNTGNIIRLCANTGSELHLIRPLGFKLDDQRMKRAGLDYHEMALVQVHATFEDFLQTANPQKIYAIETCGTRRYTDVSFHPEDALVFGSETRGLSPTLLKHFPSEQQLLIPMRPGNRSLNLSNAVAIVVYEAWRQLQFNTD